MTPSLFILSITCYFVSIASALMLLLFPKLISSSLVNSIILVHFLAIVLWFIIQFVDAPTTSKISNYVFLMFFCTGTIAAGMVIRKSYSKLLKSYFSLFLASLIVFVISPSRVIGFVSSGNIYTINPKKFYLGENYFLIETKNTEVVLNNDSISFKLVREMGMFHKTLNRGIMLGTSTDSVRMIDFQIHEKMNVIVYSQNSGKIDSIHKIIWINNESSNSNTITRKNSK